jgi:CDP-paratose 2-epimerase
VVANLAALREDFASRLDVVIADVRDAAALQRVIARVDRVFHFAAQVAVTTSLVDPVEDFDINTGGTLTLLEAIRARPEPPPLVYTSTNKVYGALEDLGLRRRNRRYEPVDPGIALRGVGESRPLDFYSPYGCSKGAADQYVRDYARTFGLPAIVFRMSCIYGPHQLGTEDQGWVAHFLIQALDGRPITLYGDGRQVRDILFVDDLVEALLLAQRVMPTESGRVFNIGGGPDNSVSLLELLQLIGDRIGRAPAVAFDAWRPGDQRYFVSDTRGFEQVTGWRPAVSVHDGVARLAEWLADGRPGRSRTRAAGAGR